MRPVDTCPHDRRCECRLAELAVIEAIGVSLRWFRPSRRLGIRDVNELGEMMIRYGRGQHVAPPAQTSLEPDPK